MRKYFLRMIVGGVAVSCIFSVWSMEDAQREMAPAHPRAQAPAENFQERSDKGMKVELKASSKPDGERSCGIIVETGVEEKQVFWSGLWSVLWGKEKP